MALRNYNNNERNITNSTFSSIVFSNAESSIMQSKFSIGYFNKLMKISIALRNNAGSNDAYATYDNDNQINVYVSYTKAYMLARMIEKFQQDPNIHNVCIELKNGLLKVSDGSEYNGAGVPCISISYADESGNVNEVVYETKTNFTAAYNYSNGSYETENFTNMEIDTFKMALDEYYKAASYAVAASVMEANMYKRDYTVGLLKGIAGKVGYETGNGNNRQYNSKTFLSNNNNRNASGNSMVPKEYEATSFDDLANNM